MSPARVRAGAVIALAIAVSPAALAQTEAEMFGEPEPEPAKTSTTAAKTSTAAQPPPPTGRAASVEDKLFEAPATDEYVAKRLDTENDKLDLGGLMYLRFEYSFQEGAAAAESPIRSPNLLDVYLDARPSDRLRAYVQARLNYDPSLPSASTATTAQTGTALLLARPRQQLEVLLDQLWLKLDIERTVFITAGRQRIKWGSGRTWNPTDFLNREAKNPLDIFDARTGVNLLKIHVPVESLGWNFYAIATTDDAPVLEQIGGALRAEILLGDTEVALSGALRKDRPVRLGLDVTMPIWDFDIHAEGALTHDLRTPFFRGGIDFRNLMIPEEYSRADEWIPQLVVGADIQIKYSDEDNVLLGAEYFYNGAGYSDETIYPYLFLRGTYVPFYTGQHYASAFVLLMQPGSWNDSTVLLAALSNISDGSVVVRFDFQQRVITYLNANIFAMWHTGSEGELRPGLHIPPGTGLPGLDMGLEVAPPLFAIGGGLQLEM